MCEPIYDKDGQQIGSARELRPEDVDDPKQTIVKDLELRPKDLPQGSSFRQLHPKMVAAILMAAAGPAPPRDPVADVEWKTLTDKEKVERIIYADHGCIRRMKKP